MARAPRGLSFSRSRSSSPRILSERETSLVRQLGFFRYLTPRQAAELLFADSPLKARSREVIAGRLLSRLRRAGLVTTNAHEAGEPDAAPTRVVHFLTGAGQRTFVVLEPDAPLRRVRVRGALLVAHSVMLADIALAFRRSALGCGHDLSRWECDWQIGQQLAGTGVAPDARLVYATGRRRIHAFVEADRGTEGVRFFSGKVERYLELHRSGAWRGVGAVWPLVLTVTRSESRALGLRHATESVLEAKSSAAMSPAFRFAAIDDLRQEGPLARIWLVPGRTGRDGIADFPDGEAPPIDGRTPRASM